MDFGFHQCSGSSNWVIKRYIFGPITPYYYPLDLRSGFSKMAALCHKHLYQKNLQQKPGSAFYVLTGKTILISKNNFKQTTICMYSILPFLPIYMHAYANKHSTAWELGPILWESMIVFIPLLSSKVLSQCVTVANEILWALNSSTIIQSLWEFYYCNCKKWVLIES